MAVAFNRSTVLVVQSNDNKLSMMDSNYRIMSRYILQQEWIGFNIYALFNEFLHIMSFRDQQNVVQFVVYYFVK